MRMTENEAHKMAFDVRTISDEQLAALRKLATGPILSSAGRLATWLHRWCDYEQVARAKDTDLRTLKHCLFLPQLAEYADAELADATAALLHLSFSAIEEGLTFPVDRILVAAVELTCERLRERVDP